MKRSIVHSLAIYIILLLFFVIFSAGKTIAAPPPTEVTLDNGFRITYLGSTINKSDQTSTWRYLVEELPIAQDLSSWMLELFDCHEITTATPSSWWYETPDPNMKLNGIKWQGAGVAGSAEFTVTLKGYWKTGTNQVAAKGPDVALGFLAGPSCEKPNLFTSSPINFILTRNPQLKLNEFLSANEGTSVDPDWIEIHNSGNTAIDLQNYYLTNDLATNPILYQVPESIIIQAGGFVLFYADASPQLGANHTNFNLNEISGEIAIVKPNGTTVVDSYSYGNQSVGVSEGRCPDGNNTWTTFTTPTPGGSNGTCP